MRIVGTILWVVVSACPVAAATLQAQLLPATGEVRLRNDSQAAVPFVIYSIVSPGGALVPSDVAWNSIADHYDVNGDGSVDSRGSWIKLTASSNELAEGVLLGPGGALAVQQTISLGRIWQVGKTAFPDLSFSVTQPNGQSVSVGVEFAVDGDYNRNGMVDASDYVVWRNSDKTFVPEFGGADGSGDGIVDTTDLAIWRSSYGAVLRPDGSVSFGLATVAALTAAAVPEPTTCIAACIAVFGTVLCRRRSSPVQERRHVETRH